MIYSRMKRPKELAEAEKRFRRQLNDVALEKGDFPAMLIAAFAVFVPATLIVIAILVLIPMLALGIY